MSTTPMTASTWLAVLKAEGVDVRGYGSWTTHGRDSATGKTFGPVNGIVIHHTAGTNSLALCYNGTSSLPGPLCHTHLAKTGVASMLSVRRANHAGTFAQNAHDAVLAESSVHPYPDAAEPVDGNDHYYGIEIENLGTGNDRYPWKQYVAAVKWATAICRYHGWTQDSIIGHKEGTRRKIDPKGPVQGPDGTSTFEFTMNRFRADVKAALALPAGVWPNAVQEDDDLTPEQAAQLNKVASDLVALTTKVNALVAGQKLAPWQYENLEVNGTADTYKLLTDANGNANTGRLTAGRVETAVKDIKAKVDALSTGGVDLDALAVKVADLLAARLVD